MVRNVALEDVVDEKPSVAEIVVTVRDEELFWKALLNVYRGVLRYGLSGFSSETAAAAQVPLTRRF